MLAPSPRSGADCLASCRCLPIVVLDFVVWREQALVRLVSVAGQSSENRWPPGVAGEARALGQRPWVSQRPGSRQKTRSAGYTCAACFAKGPVERWSSA